MRTLRRALAAAAAAVLAAGTLTVVTQSAAQAHGAPLVPGSRNYLCWLDARTPQGSLNPTNEACRTALQTGGDTAYWNWFGSLRGDGGGRTTGFVPNDNPCGGGNPTFSAFGGASTAWPYTRLTAGSTINVRYNKWAAHPGWWRMYISRDGWQSGGLTLDDFEGLPAAGQPVRGNPFDEVLNPTSVGPVGSVEGYYTWNARLPSGKSGRHVIYTVWARTDSQETFYTCTDVNFDGGSGQVVGVGNPVPPPPPPPTDPPPPPPPTDPPPPPPPTDPPGTGACTATYANNSSWGQGFQGTVTIRNSGTAPLSAWTVALNMGSATINNLWNGVNTGTTGNITVRNAGHNGSVPPNSTASFGFVANGSVTPTVTGCG